MEQNVIFRANINESTSFPTALVLPTSLAQQNTENCQRRRSTGCIDPHIVYGFALDVVGRKIYWTESNATSTRWYANWMNSMDGGDSEDGKSDGESAPVPDGVRVVSKIRCADLDSLVTFSRYPDSVSIGEEPLVNVTDLVTLYANYTNETASIMLVLV